MRRLLSLFVLVLALAAPALASPIALGDHVIVGDTSYRATNALTPGNPGIGGGPFLLSPTGTSDFDAFLTLCVQRLETISLGGTYTVSGITDEIKGAPGSTGAFPYKLRPETAFLFTKYSPTFVGNSRDTNGLIQAAVWDLQGYFTPGTDNSAWKSYLDEAAAAGWTDIGNVRVVNLVDANRNPVQDQLAIYPVPEPGSMSLLGIGLLALGNRIRKWGRVA